MVDTLPPNISLSTSSVTKSVDVESWQMIKPPFHNPFGALAGLRGSQPAPEPPVQKPGAPVGAAARSEDVSRAPLFGWSAVGEAARKSRSSSSWR